MFDGAGLDRIQPRFQLRIIELCGNGQPMPAAAARFKHSSPSSAPSTRARGDLTNAQAEIELQPQQFANLPHG